MLTKELAIAECRDGFLLPDRLYRQHHGHYLAIAEQLLELYRAGVGQTRRELHAAARKLFEQEQDCPLRRIDAFCKLLDDASTFDKDRRGAAAQLRAKVFRMAAKFHPLVVEADSLFEHAEAVVKDEIAQALGTTWESISDRLFADVIPYQKLAKFTGYATPGDLLARYNVAQCQAALYRAQSLTVWATEDLKIILRYAKLARLVHTIDEDRNGTHRLYFDGPASVLRATSRYGVAMARFLPSLLACRGWRMEAKVAMGRGGWTRRLCLSADDGLRSALPPPEEFDSQVEADFAADWAASDPSEWTMSRETVVLHQGQKTFVPDFVFQQAQGRRVLLEIAGFWTPEYLASKRESLERFLHEDILLAAPESLLKQANVEPWLRDYPGLIRYKTGLKAVDVLRRLCEQRP